MTKTYINTCCSHSSAKKCSDNGCRLHIGSAWPCLYRWHGSTDGTWELEEDDLDYLQKLGPLSEERGNCPRDKNSWHKRNGDIVPCYIHQQIRAIANHPPYKKPSMTTEEICETDSYGNRRYFSTATGSKLLHRTDGPAVKYANGDQYWYHQGLLHREGGLPATLTRYGEQYWYEGERHREDGPAVINRSINGRVIYEWWVFDKQLSEEEFTKRFMPFIDSCGVKCWKNPEGQLHREDGPAIERPDGTKEWWFNDKLHREDGPAVECASGTKFWYQHGSFHREYGPAIEYPDGTKKWFKDSLLHREDGPAIVYCYGDKEWWIDGKQLTQEQHTIYRGQSQFRMTNVVDVPHKTSKKFSYRSRNPFNHGTIYYYLKRTQGVYEGKPFDTMMMLRRGSDAPVHNNNAIMCKDGLYAHYGVEIDTEALVEFAENAVLDVCRRYESSSPLDTANKKVVYYISRHKGVTDAGGMGPKTYDYMLISRRGSCKGVHPGTDDEGLYLHYSIEIDTQAFVEFAKHLIEEGF